MFKIKIADLIVEIKNKYEFVEKQCINYILINKLADFCVCASEEEIANERKISEGNFSDGYLESVCIYRNIAYQLPKFDAFLFHSSVVKVAEKAYAFSAKSGTGKSTHTTLWSNLLGDEMTYINGDKPILRIINGKIFAFGTPWCGKEGYNTNDFAQLYSVCFIERAKVNSISILDKKIAAKKIMHQIVMPKSSAEACKTLELLDYTIKSINIWLLKCNKDISAAILSYNTIKGD